MHIGLLMLLELQIKLLSKRINAKAPMHIMQCDVALTLHQTDVLSRLECESVAADRC